MSSLGEAQLMVLFLVVIKYISARLYGSCHLWGYLFAKNL